jgi:hypothetical protein
MYDLEAEIDQWRAHARRRQAVSASDVDELEDHLRARIDELSGAGLAADEAFLIAVKRMGGLDELSREFAREHSERLWKQLVLTLDGSADDDAVDRRELFVVAGLAVAAAVAIKVPELLGHPLSDDEAGGLYLRNAGLLVLPFTGAYLAWTGACQCDFAGFLVL